MKESVKEQIIHTIVPIFKPVFLIVFGSHAKGNVRPDSDIDIAFYSEHFSPTSYETFMLAQELADILKTEVDLVNLREASTVFQAQVFAFGETIYCTDENIRIREQMRALSMYVKLNEERAEILKKIDERGSIYGK